VDGRTLAEADKLIFEGRLFDARSSKEVLSKRYKFGQGALRAAATGLPTKSCCSSLAREA